MIHSMLPTERPSTTTVWLCNILFNVVLIWFLVSNAVKIDGQRAAPEVTLGPPVIEPPAIEEAPLVVPPGTNWMYIYQKPCWAI